MNEPNYLNNQAMQIILHAGNARTLINEAINSIIEDSSLYQNKLDGAHQELVSAHKIQTTVIQETIDLTQHQTTLLFTHAQDTLMTVYSEYNITRNMIKLYEKTTGA